MNLLDWIAKKLEYVKASEISVYEALLAAARENEGHLQAEVVSLEEKVAASDADIVDMRTQLEQYSHSAMQSAMWENSIKKMLVDRGLDLDHLLNGNSANYNPSKLDTYAKLKTALQKIPEIRVVPETRLHPPFAYNIFSHHAAVLPLGKIAEPGITVAQIFKDLLIEDRLSTYSQKQ